MARSKDFKKLRPTLLFQFNILLQLVLFVIFLSYFGIPSVTKYFDKKTMVVHSEEETYGIEAPAITLFAMKDTGIPMVTLGWRTKDGSLTSMPSFNMIDHCRKIGFTDVEACVSNDTFELGEFLKEAQLNLFDGKDTTSLFRDPSTSPLWTEDMTVTFSGRYFTLKLPKTITRREYDAILFRVDTVSSFIYTFFVHDENYFIFNINPFSLPGKRWQLHGNTLNASGYSHDLTLTKHKRLNLEGRPCEEDLAYNFTVCVKERLSERIGCRLPWDKWSQQERAECTSKRQFDQFELAYLSLLNANADVISERTGCKLPCNYKEYKFVESSPNPIPNPQSVAFWAASHKTHIEEEVLIYPFTSLVAEFGGSLGLFLGFSFITIWHEIRGYFCSA